MAPGIDWEAAEQLVVNLQGDLQDLGIVPEMFELEFRRIYDVIDCALEHEALAKKRPRKADAA